MTFSLILLLSNSGWICRTDCLAEKKVLMVSIELLLPFPIMMGVEDPESMLRLNIWSFVLSWDLFLLPWSSVTPTLHYILYGFSSGVVPFLNSFWCINLWTDALDLPHPMICCSCDAVFLAETYLATHHYQDIKVVKVLSHFQIFHVQFWRLERVRIMFPCAIATTLLGSQLGITFIL